VTENKRNSFQYRLLFAFMQQSRAQTNLISAWLGKIKSIPKTSSSVIAAEIIRYNCFL